MTRFVLPLFCLLLLSLVGTGTETQVDSAAQTIENGKFRFYETKQIRGEENYSISRTSNGELLVQARTDLPFIGEEKSLW